jgi:hypothetical protein
VSVEGNGQQIKDIKTKDEAVRRARELAKAQELGQVKIHGTDGRIEREYTYGNDPRSRG